MSFPDYHQKIEDHQSLLILVKQVGCHLKPKAFSSLYERMCRLTSVHIHSQQRKIHLRYIRTYPLESNDWGDFQAHRKVVGLICIGKCDNENEVTEIYRLYEDLDQAYSQTLYDSRLFLFGLNKDGSVLERHLRKLSESDSSIREMDSEDVENSNVENGHTNDNAKDSKSGPSASAQSSPRTSPSKSPISGLKEKLSSVRSPKTSPKQVQRAQNLDTYKHKRMMPPKDQSATPKPHVLCYPREDQCPDLEEVLQDYVATLFWILESKRLDRSHERQEKPPLLMTPFEKKELASVDTETRQYKKRCQGRLRKHLGDLCLLSGLPGEALLHYQTALDILKSASDWMWLGGTLEGICAANVAIAKPSGEVSGFPRNLSFSSFSLKRGKSAAKESRFKPGAANRGPSNGVDLDDSRNRTNVDVDGVIEKYRDAILNYSKFQSSGMLEMETSLKACRFATTHMRYLAAADFLQNVVYINLPLSEEEKTQRYLVMASMYDDLGFRRKASLFKRLAGMQCVSLSNPKPGWQQCYHLLIRALDGYKLSLDPKDMPEDRAHGWPLVQMRVLHEIIFTARKMGNPAIAIRHLCYLLHTMFHHLLPAERKELSSILESYTVRCEAAPQSLALDNGTILPPVPFLRFPVVKNFKLQDPPLHLRPVRLKPPQNAEEIANAPKDLFIYSPLQRVKAAPPSELQWVEGDNCGVILQLYNPMPYELKITALGLITEDVPCEMIPQNLTLPAESGPFQVKITVRPLEPGELSIVGYTTKILGVKSLCRLRDLPHLGEPKVKVKVVSSLPTLQVATSLPKDSSFSSLANSDIVVTSATAAMYAGQSLEWELKLTNSSKVPVNFISMSVSSKGDRGHQKELLVWNEENLRAQLPLQPGAQACVNVYISSTLGTNYCDKPPNTAYEAVSNTPKNDGSFGQYIESLLKIQYSAGKGLVDQYCRQCAVAVTIEIQPSVLVKTWCFTPSASISHCNLEMEVENVTKHTVKLVSDDKTVTSIPPTQCQKCSMPVLRLSLQENRSTISSDEGISSSQSSRGSCQSSKASMEASWQQNVSRDHLHNFVDVRWKMPCEGKEGRLSLDNLRLSSADVGVLHRDNTEWELHVGAGRTENSDVVECHCGQTTNVRWSMLYQSEQALRSVYTSLKVFSEHDSWHDAKNLLHTRVLVAGCDTVSASQLSSGEKIENSCSLIFLCPGVYKLEVTCQGEGHPNDDTPNLQKNETESPGISIECETSGNSRYVNHSPILMIKATQDSGE